MSINNLRFAFLAALATACLGFSQNNEIGLTLGRVSVGDRSLAFAPSAISLGAGTTFQANYGRRLFGGAPAALFFEVHFAATPQQEIESPDTSVPRDFASLFLTPGFRLKFLPDAGVSPFVLAGGGYAQFEQSVNRLDGLPNNGPRRTHRGAFVFGGGVDVKVWRFFSLRGEIRDFYTGNPAYNAPLSSSGQHNVIAGGGFALRF